MSKEDTTWREGRHERVFRKIFDQYAEQGITVEGFLEMYRQNSKPRENSENNLPASGSLANN